MKKYLLIAILILSWEFSAQAEQIELFPPFSGAVAYEVKINSPQTKKSYNFLLEKPEIQTDEIEAGNYIMQARYKNASDQWSPWTENANLKIRKSVRTKAFGDKVLVLERVPYSLSIGTSNLETSILGQGEHFKSSENVLHFKGLLQKSVYKFVLNYDKSSNLTRFDSSIIKMLDPHAGVGINLWMMNFNAGRVIANYSQLFAEGNYVYPFHERWHVFLRGGVGLSLNYYFRPEIIYSVPYGKELVFSASLTYEKSKVDQSGFLFEANGPGIMVNMNYFVDI